MTGPGPRHPAVGLVGDRSRQGGDERDYLVSGQDVLAVVEELWLAGAEGVAVNGERVTVATAIVDIGGSVLVNSAYVAPPYQVSAIGPPDMFERLTGSPGFVDFIRARAETFGIGVDYAIPEAVDLPAYAGSVNLRYGRPSRPRRRAAARRRRPDAPAVRAPRGRAPSCSCSGFLVVVQLRSQAADQGLSGLSVQELTRARRQPDDAQQPAARGDRGPSSGSATRSRRPSSAATRRRSRSGPTSTAILGWSGRAERDRGRGPGHASTGALPGDAVEQLLNELRNAGAEAIAIGDDPGRPGRRAQRARAAAWWSRACRSRTRSSSWRSASRRRWRDR